MHSLATSLVRIAAVFALTSMTLAQQQPTTAETAARTNTSFIDAQGTAHVTRIVPVPKTISPEAQGNLARPASDAAAPSDLAQRRAGTDTWQEPRRRDFPRRLPRPHRAAHHRRRSGPRRPPRSTPNRSTPAAS